MSVSPDSYVRALDFYAHQMALLDALDLEGYAQTFTPDGVTDHAHRGVVVEGRDGLLAHARAALPRYAGRTPRHWNAHYAMTQAVPDTVRVTYSSLVTTTDRSDGSVHFESTFTVEDELVTSGDSFQVRRRTIQQDRDPILAGGAP